MTVLVPQYLQKKLIPARFDRQLLADIFRKGVISSGDLQVSAGGGVNVSIAKGRGYIPGTLNTDQGVYRLFNDAAFTLGLNAPVSNPRMDTIIMRIYDSIENAGAGPDQATLEVAQGTENASVTRTNRNGGVLDSALPANSVAIADVIVRPASPVLAADIVDRRLLAMLKADFADIKYQLSVTNPLGWKAAIGQAVERGPYADIFNALTFGRAGNTTNASATISNLSTTADLAVGMGITGAGIPIGTVINSIVNGTSITISNNATATTPGVPLTFYTTFGSAFVQTGTTTSGLNTVTGLTSTSDMYIGMPMSSGTGIPAGAYVASITSSTAITMSQNATLSGARGISFVPHGAGDGVGTFNLPDMRGMAPVGAGKAPTLTQRVLGVVGGEEKHTQLAGELPSHTHAQITRTANADYGDNVISAFSGPSDGPLNAYSSRAPSTNTVSPTDGGPGSATPFNVMPPYKAAQALIYTGTAF